MLLSQFQSALIEAMSYLGNPRNLEHPWRHVFMLCLLGLLHDLNYFSVHLETPIWVIYHPRYKDRRRTLALSHGKGKSLTPDLHLGYMRLTRQLAIACRYKTGLVENKRAPSRNGDETLSASLKADEQLYFLLDLAVQQVEAQAKLHFLATRATEPWQQRDIILMATSGPIFVIAWATRSMFDTLPDRWAYRELETLDELELDEEDEDEEDGPFDQPNHPSSPIETLLNEFRGKHKIASGAAGCQWIGPFCLNTAGANEVLLDVKKCMRSFRPDGTMDKYLKSDYL